VLSFLVFPALWICASIAIGMQAVWAIPVAVGMALVSAMIGYRSGPGLFRAVAYFLGTGAMMGVAFAIAVATLFAICGNPDC
jgi:hypothetical protein